MSKIVYQVSSYDDARFMKYALFEAKTGLEMQFWVEFERRLRRRMEADGGESEPESGDCGGGPVEPARENRGSTRDGASYLHLAGSAGRPVDWNTARFGAYGGGSPMERGGLGLPPSGAGERAGAEKEAREVRIMNALEALADGLYAVMSDTFVERCRQGYGRRRWQS